MTALHGKITGGGMVNLDINDVMIAAGGAKTVDVIVAESDNILNELGASLRKSFKKGRMADALINIIGGKGTTLDDLNAIGSKLAKHLHPNSKVIWGYSVEPGIKKTKATVLIFGK